MNKWSRREFVRFATVGAGAGIAGCSALSPSESTENGSEGRDEGEGPPRAYPVGEPVVGSVDAAAAVT
jgi:hypothetical protein